MIDMYKKTLLMAVAVMMGIAATAQNTITFKGSIRNAEGKKVLLMYSDGAENLTALSLKMASSRSQRKSRLHILMALSLWANMILALAT